MFLVTMLFFLVHMLCQKEFSPDLTNCILVMFIHQFAMRGIYSTRI